MIGPAPAARKGGGDGGGQDEDSPRATLHGRNGNRGKEPGSVARPLMTQA